MDDLPDLSSIQYTTQDVFEDVDDEFESPSEFESPLEFEPPLDEPIDEPTDDDTIMELRVILQLYKLKFKEELTLYKNIEIDNLNYDELIELRKKFDFVIGCRSASDNQVKMLYGMIYAIEQSCVSNNILDCQGLTHTLALDKQFQKDLTRLSLKYITSWSTKPEIAVGMRVVSTALSLDKNNQLKKINEREKNNSKINEKIDKINDKFQDL